MLSKEGGKFDMEYKNSVFDDSRKIFIFDNGKDITDMFTILKHQREEWYEPYDWIY